MPFGKRCREAMAAPHAQLGRGSRSRRDPTRWVSGDLVQGCLSLDSCWGWSSFHQRAANTQQAMRAERPLAWRANGLFVYVKPSCERDWNRSRGCTGMASAPYSLFALTDSCINEKCISGSTSKEMRMVSSKIRSIEVVLKVISQAVAIKRSSNKRKSGSSRSARCNNRRSNSRSSNSNRRRSTGKVGLIKVNVKQIRLDTGQ